MGCCRGAAKRRDSTAPQNIPAPCKTLEQGGAGLKLWPKNIGGEYRLMMQDPTKGNAFVSVLEFIQMHGCNGPVSRMIKSNLVHILGAVAQNPAAFQKNGSFGFSLVTLLRTADTVRSSGRSYDRRVHPFASR